MGLLCNHSGWNGCIATTSQVWQARTSRLEEILLSFFS